MTYFEQIEVIAKTTEVTCKRPLTSTEKAAYGIIFDLCEAGKKLEAENAKLEAENAKLEAENSHQKRVINILENRVLEFKGMPIPMAPRLPTCDALVRPRYILQSNCSNAKEDIENE